MTDENALFQKRLLRRVKKKNKQIATEVPMFAGFFATTPEIETENLKRIDRMVADSARRLVEFNARCFWEARYLQEEAACEMSIAQYHDAVVGLRRLRESFTVFRQPVMICDYWRTRLKEV